MSWCRIAAFGRRATVSVRKYGTESVRVRFAPSPTGFLHLGGLRTALYNYLFAVANKGKFALRIEDTDQSRTVQGAVEALINDLQWSGIEFDEGPTREGPYGPYVQSERTHIYQEHVEKLLDNGSAYRCFCSDKRIDLLRREALRTRQIPRYDNKCRKLANEEVKEKLNNDAPHCIRFKLTSDCTTFEDLVYGTIAYDVSLNEGDPVIMKSDGFPTYHFANVVDDHMMRISHVLRGVEWQISTTKHLLLYRAFGWNPPLYAHLPLIVNVDGTKLSKRQNDIRVSEYRTKGILPNALINYITLAGGGFDRNTGDGVIAYTIQELANSFRMDRVNSHPSRLNPELLIECNRLELMEQIKNDEKLENLIKDVQEMLKMRFVGKNIDATPNHVASVLKWSSGRMTNIEELTSPSYAFLWVLPEDNIDLDQTNRNVILELSMCLNRLNEEQFESASLKRRLKTFTEENDVKFSGFMKLLRKALSGLDEGPGVSEMMEILGKRSTVERLQFLVRNK